MKHNTEGNQTTACVQHHHMGDSSTADPTGHKYELCMCASGLSMAVKHDFLYSGLSGFNRALGCMTVGGLLLTFNWRIHLLAIASGDAETHSIVICV